ncbi:MAG: hypothetical protein ACKOQ5_07170, partial [Solirubrobacterales bacterium]
MGDGRHLEQLQVAGYRPVQVLGRVESRLDHLPPDPPGSLDYLVPQRPVGGLEVFGRTEELLLDLDHPASRCIQRTGEGVAQVEPGLPTLRGADPGEHRLLARTGKGRCQRLAIDLRHPVEAEQEDLPPMPGPDVAPG